MFDFISVLHEVIFESVFILCRCVHTVLLFSYIFYYGLSVRLRLLLWNGWWMHFLRQTSLIILVESWGFIITINDFLATTQISLNVDVSDHLLLKAVVDRHGCLATGSCILASQLLFLLQVWSLCFCALPAIENYCLRNLRRHLPTRSRFNCLASSDSIN